MEIYQFTLNVRIFFLKCYYRWMLVTGDPALSYTYLLHTIAQKQKRYETFKMRF